MPSFLLKSSSRPLQEKVWKDPPYSAPSTSKPAQDKLALAATLLTIVGYVCAGAGVLGFILWLAADGDGISRFATALGTLVTGLGLGGLNYGLGTWLGERRTAP